ncbi:hypothetical protein CK203_034836 [Vitis vinifera]|uniref:Uncharacterized protein n=1 Tax=Vitis vinifera TaxID=29760 RepID=A0A438IC39_VITVI|nr:hypothetical protein CK203_034836 [Vitis vinifera]
MRITSIGKRRLLGEREKVFVHLQPVLDRMSIISQPVPQPIESVGHNLDQIFHNSYCPPLLERVKLLKSYCSGKKFQSVIKTLPVEKKNVFMDMGFRGLLQLGCKELWYELITWIISNYDIGYRHLCMQSNVAIPITPQDVREVLGIPDNGMGILVYNRRDTPNHTYNIHILEDNMCNLPVGEEFKKYFLIFAYATILAPNSKQEAMHDLWDTTWDKDVIQPKELVVHNDAPPYEATSSHSDDPNEWKTKWVCSPSPDATINVERNKEEANINVHPCSDQVMRKGTGVGKTHYEQQRSTIAALDDDPFIGQESCPLSKKGAEFDSPKGVKIGVQEGSGSNMLSPIDLTHASHGISFLFSMDVIGLTVWSGVPYAECRTSNTTAGTLL